MKVGRVIKFRAWHPTGDNMVYFDNEKTANDIYKAQHLLQLMANTHQEGKDLLMQFTGLTDKNDVDIYEGDIVKILFTDWPSQSPEGKLSLDEYKDSLTKVFTIAFIEGAFQIGCPCYYSDNLTVYDDIRCGKHGYIEVVGNIHQNPELLKGE